MNRVLLFALLLLSLFSCEKLGFEIFYASADRNDGIMWDASDAFYAVRNEKAGLTMHRYNEFGELRESLSFTNVPLQEGTYEVSYHVAGNQVSDTLFATLYTLAEDGDVLTEHYDIYETPDFESWITIDKVKNNRIKGSFELALVLSPDGLPKWHEELPDTIYLTNGEFTARNLD